MMIYQPTEEVGHVICNNVRMRIRMNCSRDDVQKYFCINMASGLTPPELAT